jgi:hypothetical protein
MDPNLLQGSVLLYNSTLFLGTYKVTLNLNSVSSEQVGGVFAFTSIFFRLLQL